MKSMRFATRLLLALALVVSLLVTLPAATGPAEAAGNIYHVTTSGSSANSGLSWAAPKNLQSALNAAVSGDQIWVAAGTYKPSAVWPFGSIDPLRATFTMKDGVAIYGGFAGNESSLDARNPSVNVTILSGDIDNNDTVDANGVTTAIVGSNAYHVVNTDVLNWGVTGAVATGLTSSAVLDGFTITGGSATGGSPFYNGGGMWVHQGSPTLRNLRFVGNIGGNGGGGGMYVEPCYASTPDSQCLQTNPTLTNVVFQNNSTTASDTDGGGMKIDGSGSQTNPLLISPVLTNVTFDGNSGRLGGGLYSYNASPTLSGVTFKNNVATVAGGGMEISINVAGLTVTLTDVDFIGNSAPAAGGLYSRTSSGANISALNGTDVRFLGNRATGGNGGGLTVAVGNATLVNALFSGNTASSGGGADVRTYTNATLINATFSGNSAPYGAGVLAWGGPSAVLNLQNSIDYGNTGGTQVVGDNNGYACVPGYEYLCGTVNISYSLIQGDCPSTAKSCTNVIASDPLFDDADGADNTFGTTDDNPSLSAGSPAIDAGNNTLVPGTVTLDLAGQPRFHDDPGTVDTGVIGSQAGVVDMGAYEFQGTTIAAPDLTVTKAHTGNFAQGQTGAQYTITARNSSTTASTSGTVTVTDTLPAGLTATDISGTGWTCTLSTLTCTRSDALAKSSSYPAITLVVNVAANAPASVTNVATVSGGGETDTTNNTASDVTAINVTAVAPTITTQPANVTVTAGQTATFTAAASGSPAPTVQWQVLPVGGVWSDIAGGTSTTYSFTAQSTDNGKQYRAVFTNAAGSVPSNAATLTVTAAPMITTQPTDQTVAAGQTASFTAVASGDPLPSVQWQMRPGTGKWSDIAGATSTTYSFVAQATDSGKQYRAIFTNSAGTATSNVATLTVTQASTPPVVTTQPANQTVAVGQTATFTAAASGNPAPTVQWQMSTDGGTTWLVLLGENSTTLTLSGVTLNQNGYLFSAQFTNTAGNVTTNAATLTVTAASSAPVVTTQPANQTVVSGTLATFTAQASGDPAPTVQWQVSLDGRKWSDIAGATSTTYSFTAQLTDNGKQYRAVFTNAAGTATTKVVLLTVNTPPADLSIAKTGSYDAATNRIAWTLTVTNLGPNSADGVEVADTIAKGTRLVSVDAVTYKVKGSLVDVSLGTLTNGQAVTFHIVVQLSSRTVLPVENTATVTSTTYDPDLSNNTVNPPVTVP